MQLCLWSPACGVQSAVLQADTKAAVEAAVQKLVHGLKVGG